MEEEMKEGEVWKLLERSGAYKKGHFVLTSRFHSDRFIEKVLATANPGIRAQLARAIKRWFISNEMPRLEAVVGAPMGAITLATEVSGFFEIPVAWLEKKARVEDGKLVEELVLRDANTQIVKNKNVLLVEDIITKGTNTTKALGVLSEASAEVVAVACIVNREDFQPPEGIEFLALAQTPPEGPIVSWPPDECPLCKKGIPINTDSGHGEQFLGELKEKNPKLCEKLSQKGGEKQ
jgi:orotate phosphoribosyltransferase